MQQHMASYLTSILYPLGTSSTKLVFSDPVVIVILPLTNNTRQHLNLSFLHVAGISKITRNVILNKETNSHYIALLCYKTWCRLTIHQIM